MAGSYGGAEEELIGGVNVTPIVDVCLTLLVVFIVTASQVVNRSVPVQLPRAASAEASPPALVTVAITASGAVLVDGAPGRLEYLAGVVAAARARAAAGGAPGGAPLTGFVSADVAAPYGRFAEAVDRLRLAGVTDIALDTRPAAAP